VRLAATAAVVLALVAARAVPARGDEAPAPRAKDAPTVKAVTADFAKAFRAGDEAGMRAAAAKDVDPFSVLRRLLQQEIADAAEAVRPPRPAPAVARAYARAREEGAPPARLREVLDAWDALDEAGLAREARLSMVCATCRAAVLRSDWSACVAAAEAARAEIDAAPSGVFATEARSCEAEALGWLGRPDEAWRAFEDVAARAERMGWSAMRAWSWAGRGDAAWRAGRYADVATAYERWFALGPADGPTTWLWRTRLAVAYQRLGRRDEAVSAATRARDEAVAGGVPRTAGNAWRVLALVAEARGDWRAMAAAADAAAAAFRAARVPGDAANEERHAAEARLWLGRADLALTVFEAVRVELLSLGDAVGAGRALRAAGVANLVLRRWDTALEQLTRAVAELSATNASVETAFASYDLGRALRMRERDEEASASLTRALEVAERSGSRPLAALSRAQLGDVARSLGRRSEARAFLEKAAEDADRLGDDALRSTVELYRGHLEEAEGRPEAAIARYEAAIRLREGTSVPGIQPWLSLAWMRLERGEKAACLAVVRAALARRAPLPRGLAEEEGMGLVPVDRGLCDLGVQAAWPASGDASPGALAAAFELAERGHARSLVRTLANPADGDASADPALRFAEARAREAVARAQRDLDDLAASGADAGRLGAARADLDAAYRAQREAAARVGRTSRDGDRWVDPEVASLDEARAGLPPGTAFVLYHVTARSTYAFVLTRERAAGFVLGDGHGLVRAATAYARLASTPGSREEAAAVAAHAALLAPLEPALAGVSRLVIAPDASLALFPFGACASAEAGSPSRPRRLVERFEVAYAFGASASRLLADDAARRGSGLLAVGDPVYAGEVAPAGGVPVLAALRGVGSLGRIPESGDEVREIAALFPPTDATTLVRGEATSARVLGALAARGGRRLAALHLACHGYVDADHPALSGLALSGGEFLTVDAIQRTRLPADLAVLSACESAGGRVVAGEGVLGLVRAFHVAGVPRVVVSDWAVPDAGTRPLMRRFYAAMREKGLSPAAALAAAQRASIAEGGPASHPSAWAAFVFWGVD
jgi:CHAT domain-containing protein/tetratricopeptide (TPR) repeat protein